MSPASAAPMRILQVIHQFPPHSSQGSEVYCRDLSLALRARGDVVGVFHTSNARPRFPRRLVESLDQGISIFHCIDGGEYARVTNWPNPFLRDCFATVLQAFRPDVVHVHNYISLGDDVVGLARAAGACIVCTLHDYGLICPNNLLRQSSGAVCGKADSDFFQDCCPAQIRVSNGHVPRLRSLLPSLARWQALAEQQPRPALRQALRFAVSLATRGLGDPRVIDIAAKRALYLGATRRIFHGVDLFLSPSAFLRERYIACGLDPARVRHVRNGIRHFHRAPRAEAARIHFGYLGAIHPHKGVELLVRAFRGLGDLASLHVHGAAFGSPISEAYVRRLRGIAGPGTYFHGAYDNARIGDVLAGLDVVVAPSLWYENSPLTIQEAFHAGVPVVTADAGGMAELVRHDVDGLLFRLGDEADLAATLRRIAEHPEIVGRLRAQVPAVPSIEQQADVVRACYTELMARGT